MSPSQDAARRFCENPIWDQAVWIATTFRWHPTSEAPPVMGLVFADWVKGVNLFRSWTDDWGNADEEDDIRVAIIEGDIPGQAPGYCVHISAAVQEGSDSDAQLHRGQWQRMHPLPEMPNMLQEFKREYLKHREFLLAPVVQRDDDQLWFNAEAGIIKHDLFLRHASELSADDPDAVVLTAPPLVLPELRGAQ